ncbi:phosphotransferase [Shimia sp. R9_1]|uniref:phosphotransferase enzyme family protein n=1 Tax=Shimia sp. R9_1 TaxID=2821111 RepID=UPI001ADA07C8|nr:phosphotransferase [Shimia sp. R9_1]MBO9407141.1 phosphotransferase [Shimia sp. R9_1]
MTEAEALKAAQDALKAWGVTATPRLIKNRENIVLESEGPEGQRAALRLHRPGYQSDDAIRSELWWSEALVAAGMTVPQPIRTLDGEVLATGGARVASLVTWLDGEPLGEGGVPLAMPPAEQEALHEALGAELARLHMVSDDMTRPEAFERATMDLEALLGSDPAWGRYWENPSLTEAESAELRAAGAELREVIAKHAEQGGDFGLIHADALRENVLQQGDQVRLIDFDDGVFGFRMYELGVQMSQNWDQPNREELGAALLRGYATVRALPERAEDLLEAFTLMRGLASCGWTNGRYADDDPAVRGYAERALEMARRWRG